MEKLLLLLLSLINLKNTIITIEEKPSVFKRFKNTIQSIHIKNIIICVINIIIFIIIQSTNIKNIIIWGINIIIFIITLLDALDGEPIGLVLWVMSQDLLSILKRVLFLL